MLSLELAAVSVWDAAVWSIKSPTGYSDSSFVSVLLLSSLARIGLHRFGGFAPATLGSCRVGALAGRAIPLDAGDVFSVMDALSDDALLAGVASGDEDATAALIRRYQNRVFGLALSMLGDRNLAEDVAQEVFVRVWRNAGAYDARRGSVLTWVLTITRNLAIDAIRARGHRPTDQLDLFVLGLESVLRTPDAAALLDDEVSRVRSALAGLPVGQRRAVVLASFGGRTAREIGELDGIPLGTAKTRIRDGLKQLRKALTVEEPSP